MAVATAMTMAVAVAYMTMAAAVAMTVKRNTAGRARTHLRRHCSHTLGP